MTPRISVLFDMSFREGHCWLYNIGLIIPLGKGREGNAGAGGGVVSCATGGETTSSGEKNPSELECSNSSAC